MSNDGFGVGVIMGLIIGALLTGSLAVGYQTSWYESAIVKGSVAVDGGALGDQTYACTLTKPEPKQPPI